MAYAYVVDPKKIRKFLDDAVMIHSCQKTNEKYCHYAGLCYVLGFSIVFVGLSDWTTPGLVGGCLGLATVQSQRSYRIVGLGTVSGEKNDMYGVCLAGSEGMGGMGCPGRVKCS